MVAMEPTAAVVALERALRQLMTYEYSKEYGQEWLNRVTSDEQRMKWAERHDAEVRRRPGVLLGTEIGLEYSELYQLLEIAGKHWAPLSAALGKQKSIMPLLEHFERVRNTASHSRDLVVFERELMSGIAGEIRNKVTLHMTTQDPAGDFYPRIESVIDSFGTAIDIWPEINEIAGSAQPFTVLHPGDTVTIRGTATDPQDRSLAWRMEINHKRTVDERVEESGATVELQWLVTEEDIVETATLEIYMSVDGATYHRAHGFDHRAYILYRVRPFDPAGGKATE